MITIDSFIDRVNTKSKELSSGVETKYVNYDEKKRAHIVHTFMQGEQNHLGIETQISNSLLRKITPDSLIPEKTAITIIESFNRYMEVNDA